MQKKKILSALCAASLIAALAAPVSAAVGDNVMAGASVVDVSSEANSEETALHAIDGAFSTKWCSGFLSTDDAVISAYGDALAWVTYDIGEEKYINRYEIAHASLCERDYGETEFNTAEWVLLAAGEDGVWNEVSRVSGRSEEFSNVETELFRARYIRLIIISGTQNGQPIARIPELLVYESDENGARSESEAEALIAAEEARRVEADAAFRRSLVMPAVIYWSLTAAATAGVAVLIVTVKKKENNGGESR